MEEQKNERQRRKEASRWYDALPNKGGGERVVLPNGFVVTVPMGMSPKQRAHYLQELATMHQ